MEIKLMIDEDAQLSLAKALRARGYDAVNVREIGRRGFEDSAQLEYGILNGRCLFTFNVGDFVELHRAWVRRPAKTLRNHSVAAAVRWRMLATIDGSITNKHR